jgi:twitching motility two-component system response regulator PilG
MLSDRNPMATGQPAGTNPAATGTATPGVNAFNAFPGRQPSQQDDPRVPILNRQGAVAGQESRNTPPAAEQPINRPIPMPPPPTRMPPTSAPAARSGKLNFEELDAFIKLMQKTSPAAAEPQAECDDPEGPPPPFIAPHSSSASALNPAARPESKPANITAPVPPLAPTVKIVSKTENPVEWQTQEILANEMPAPVAPPVAESKPSLPPISVCIEPPAPPAAPPADGVPAADPLAAKHSHSDLVSFIQKQRAFLDATPTQHPAAVAAMNPVVASMPAPPLAPAAADREMPHDSFMAPPPEPAGSETESMAGKLSGQLSALALDAQAILPRIIAEKLTGHLQLICEGEHDNVREQLYIEKGCLLGCSSLMQTPVRRLLLSAGLVSPEDIAAAEEAAARPAEKPVPEYHLIRMGKVAKEQIYETVAAAVREAAVEAMCQPYGLFDWQPASKVTPPKTLCRIPMSEIAMHYGRRIEPIKTLRPELFNPNRVFALSAQFAELHAKFKLIPHEWKFIFRVDGQRTLREIRDSLVPVVRDLEHIVFVCDLLGLIHDKGLKSEEIATPAAPTPPAAPAQAPTLAAPAHASLAAAPALEAPPAAAPPTLPVAAPAPAVAPTVVPAVAAPGARPPQARDDRKLILVVDDSRTVQKMVTMSLESLDVRIQTADDAIEALQYAADKTPDLVLLDVIMPKMDGYKACTKLRRMMAPMKLPVIMLTAKDGTYNAIRAKLSGAATVINKPFNPEELRATVLRYLNVEK